MSIYDERRQAFCELIQKYKTYDDFILFAELMHRIVEYFESIDTPYSKPYNKNERTDSSGKLLETTFHSTEEFDIRDTEVMAFYHDEDLFDNTGVNPFSGIVTYGEGIILCKKNSNDVLETYFDVEHIPDVLNEDVFFQYSTIHSNLDMMSFVLHSYMSSVQCRAFFFDPDFMPEVLEHARIDINEYLPRSV